ncbi:MAG: D-alanyl-D-alanine carboxypeptidase family protein [Thermodesulfobacteriota bacterium]
MKRLPFFLVLLLLLTSPALAARTPLKPLSADPYAAALVIDADSGKTLFEENADARVYPASVLKLMNLYVILDRIEQGALKKDDRVQVTQEAAKIGGSQVYLDPKEQFTVDELLFALMVQSANDAAMALAIHIAGSKEGFIALMNQKAKELGMQNSQFHSVHGLPPSDGAQPDVTTARDLAILCRELVKRPQALLYTGTRSKGFRGDTFIMNTHNKLLGQVPGCDGLKTGYYEAAGFSIAATARQGGVRIIALVMGSKDRKVRDAKAAELLAKGFSLVPPKPETGATTPTPPPASPSIQSGQQATPGGSPPGQTPAPAVTPAAADVAQSAAKSFIAQATDNDRLTFLLGLGSGFLLFLACFAGLRLLKRKRPPAVSSKREKRD